jgi:glutathione S-transferase
MSHLVGQTFGGAADAQQLEKAQQQVDTVLRFFEGLLGDKFFFCSSDGISLADVVAGVSVLGLPSLGLAWDGYPKLQAWCDRSLKFPRLLAANSSHSRISRSF